MYVTLLMGRQRQKHVFSLSDSDRYWILQSERTITGKVGTPSGYAILTLSQSSRGHSEGFMSPS